MIRQADILSYASKHPYFTCRQMVEYFNEVGVKSSLNSVSSRLKRMTESGILTKQDRGVFSISDAKHLPFIAFLDSEMNSIEVYIQKHFPFIKFTVWNIWDIKNLAHHVANSDIIYVEVERDASESVFNKLMAFETERQLFYKPTDSDYERYINKPTIVVRTLVSESPLVVFETDIYRVTLEKILVDAAIDKDFLPFQGYEIVRIFRSAFDRYRINETKLFRYARRRSKEAEIKSIIQDINQEEL